MGKYFNIQYNGWHIICNFFGMKMKFRYKPKHKKVVNIILDSKAGIGNRILAIVNMLNYFTPDELYVYWDTKNWVSSSLTELFNIETKTKIIELESADFPDKNALCILGPSHILKTNNNRKLDLKYNEISNKDIDYFNQFFQNIKPSKKVQERLNNFNQEFKYVIQVRNNKDWGDFGRNEALELYFQEIDNIKDDSKIFLSAMNKDVSNVFKEKYGNRIIELDNKNYSSMIDAVCDLFIMSKAKNAIYSYGSTFGELAFWLGGAKQKVKIIGSTDNWKKVL